MAALICGSLAFDTIMTFEGRFAEQILPDQLHILNVSFLVPSLRRDFGGCAGNIAYSLKLLGGEPLPMATLGTDGGEYLQRLAALGISDRYVKQVDGTYTAQLSFYETPFLLTFNLKFSDDQLLYDCEYNVNFGPTKQPQLVGKPQ